MLLLKDWLLISLGKLAQATPIIPGREPDGGWASKFCTKNLLELGPTPGRLGGPA